MRAVMSIRETTREIKIIHEPAEDLNRHFSKNIDGQ